MKLRNLSVLLFSVFLGMACSQQPRADLSKEDIYDIPRNSWGAGDIFLWAVAYDDEQLAMSVLSTRMQLAVAEHCENGEAIACFNGGWLPEWGEIKHVTGDPSYSHGSTFTYRINNRLDEITILIVLEIINENGEWRVDSWRGLVPYDDEIINGLVDGTDTTNLFPPDFQSDVETVEQSVAIPTITGTQLPIVEPSRVETATQQLCPAYKIALNIDDNTYIICFDDSQVYFQQEIAFLRDAGISPLNNGWYFTVKDSEMALYNPRDQQVIPLDFLEHRENVGLNWLTLSPDGQYIAYSLFLFDEEPATRKQILITHLPDEITSQPITRETLGFANPEDYLGPISEVVWSPDGRQLAINEGGDVFLVDVVCDPESNECQLNNDKILHIAPPGVCIQGAVTWSPDSSQFAAICFPVEETDPNICIFNTDGEFINQFDISHLDVSPDFLSWSPDGQLIAFQTLNDKTVRYSVFILNVTDMSIYTILSSRTEDYQFPMWMP